MSTEKAKQKKKLKSLKNRRTRDMRCDLTDTKQPTDVLFSTVSIPPIHRSVPPPRRRPIARRRTAHRPATPLAGSHQFAILSRRVDEGPYVDVHKNHRVFLFFLRYCFASFHISFTSRWCVKRNAFGAVVNRVYDYWRVWEFAFFSGTRGR